MLLSCMSISKGERLLIWYRLYIHGGHDLSDPSLYLLDLNHLPLHSTNPPTLMWHLLDTIGPNPGCISHHTCSVYNHRMYLFGGTKVNGMDNRGFYSLDLRSYRWELIPSNVYLITYSNMHSD